MSFTADRLYALLPAIYRIRDRERGGALREIIEVIAHQVAALEEDLDQLYDDQFIETCAKWVVPYIGDLVGFRDTGRATARLGTSRAQVANIIDLRRRKGSASALEDLAGDLTEWPAVAVEFYRRLATTQHLNHLRLHSTVTPSVRSTDAAVWNQAAFDTRPRTVDVRLVSSRRGLHNIPNLAVFLWRIASRQLHEATPVRVDARRFRVSPLGNDTPMFVNPVPEAPGDELGRRTSVPLPLRRLAAARAPAFFYGAGASVEIQRDGALVPLTDVRFCDLSDDPANPGAWANPPSSGVAIDPELGRLAFAADVPASSPVGVTWCYGSAGDIGGGEYDRSTTVVGPATVPVPGTRTQIGPALADVAGHGIVEIAVNGRFEESIGIAIAPNGHVELRAADRARPVIVLTGDLVVTGGEGSSLTLNGVVISGGRVVVPAQSGGADNRLARLRLLDCTLVPGRALTAPGDPASPGAESLVIETPNTALEVERSIVGATRVEADSRAEFTDSVVDANGSAALAYTGIGGRPGGPLRVVNCTVVGGTTTRQLWASNAIFLGRVHAERAQAGCVRYSFVPAGSRTPRRYRCQPAAGGDEAAVRPRFASLQYGRAAYCQLRPRCAVEIRRGADNASEMGVYNRLEEAAREQSLGRAFEEFVPFGMDAGIVFAS